MIFVQGYGNKNYSKLNEVMHLNSNKKQENQDGYEKLTQIVDENYRTFSSNMNYHRLKHSKMNMKLTTNNFKPVIHENQHTKTKRESSLAIFCQTINNFEVKVNSLEEKFICKFKNAVKKNSGDMLNYDKFNKIVTEKLIIQNKNQKMKNEKINRLKAKEISSINKDIPKEGNKINVISDENKEKNDFDLIKPKDEISLTKDRSEIAIESLKKIDSIITKSPSEKKMFLYRLQKILRSALTYLYENNIPIFLYYEIRPIPTFPLSKAKSKEFFEEVKLGNDKRVRELLQLDTYLIFEYDHFKQTGYHWAAKRGLKSTLELLISFGNHINLYDLNKRTPLFLAAKNNHFEVCKYLLDKGANPFLKSSNGKKAIDICSDESIKRILKVNMDNISAINKWIEVADYHKNVKSFDSNIKNHETNDNI